MNQSIEERLLSFLDGRMSPEERERLLVEVERSPDLSRALQDAARGRAMLEPLPDDASSAEAGLAIRRSAPERRVVPLWSLGVAAAAAALITAPLTMTLATSRPPGIPDAPSAEADRVAAAIAAGRPVSPQPSFVLVLHRWWPDAASIDDVEITRRSREYWAWTTQLAQEGRLVAAGDLRIEPGRRLGAGGAALPVADAEPQSGDFVIGMFAVRAATYEEAVALASECPHLRYGGSVSVRQVGGGFVTLPGGGDWAG